MSVNRSKKGIDGEGGDRSNVSKIIVKQGLEGCLGYRANEPMTIGKKDYEEGGVATCEQQWKTADIHTHKKSGRLHVEKKQHDCGAPPPPGECWRIMHSPMLSTYNKVTGTTTNVLRKENWKKLHSCQEEQGHNKNGQLTKEMFCCQLSYHYLASIEIICARRV